MLNRSIVIVRAKTPFQDWLNSLPDPANLTLEEINIDSPTYLLPEYGFDYEKEKILLQFFDIIFEELLNDWWTVENDWPQERTFERFKEWFEVEFHSCVFDLVDGPLEDDE